MRFRYVLLLVVFAVLLGLADASAQKRINTVVDPNSNAFSDTIDVFDPATGTITTVTDKLSVGRERPAVFRLASGKVLIAGGQNNRYLRGADIYDYNPDNPTASPIAETGDLLSVRSGMTTIFAPGGAALIIGGYNGNYLTTVEQYDTVSEKFIMTGGMATPRQFATATLLSDGTILVAGGFNGTFLDVAEVYDHPNRTFTMVYGAMTQSRAGHVAARIADKKVLIAGGCTNSKSDEMVCDTYLDTAEIFDASADEGDEFSTTGSMTTARKDHTATVLNDGRILIIGGTNGVDVLDSAEIYDPETGTFSSTGKMSETRVNHTATILPDGRVVIAGGESNSGEILASVEIYNPTTGTFSPGAPMNEPRTFHAAVVATDGVNVKVLFIAGLKEHKLVFDTNYQILGDNIAGNIYFTPDSEKGFVAYTGSGTVLAFEPKEEDGGTLTRIPTGGRPIYITPIQNEQRLAVVSALDNKIFIIDPATNTLSATYEFANAVFGFGSKIELSPDGSTGYISSAGTGEIIEFDVATGNEKRRLGGFRIPAQITATRNGEILIVVDAGTNTVKGVNAANMTLRYTFEPQDRYYAALFSIHNKVVFNYDEQGNEKFALITGQDVVLDGFSAAFLFNPNTGEWITYVDADDENEEERGGVYAVGTRPGWTMLLPNGEHWLTLTQSNISLIPTIDQSLDRDDYEEGAFDTKYYSIFGSPMGSTNVVLTPDGRYAFFASATTDQLLHMDLETGGIVGAYALGDDPNLSPDQPIAVELTPDAIILAAASFASNEINLFVDSYIYRQTRYISQQDRFTGISIINVSDDQEDVIVQVTARTNSGSVHYYYVSDKADEIPNPKTLTLKPNAQVSIDISELLKLDNDVDNAGYITIDSNKPVIVGYTAIGQIQASFMSAHVRSMESVAFLAQDEVPRDMILPEIPESSDATSEISLVNPWYTTVDYSATHYASDGTKWAIQDKTLSPQAREATSSTGVTTTIAKSQVVIIGGFSGSVADASAEVFDGNSLGYRSPVGMNAARYGAAVASLASGKVLVSGGRSGSVIQRTAELYDSLSGYFTLAPGSMNVERYRHTATRLPNGLVLLAGGQNTNSITRTAELFDFTTGSFSYTKKRGNGEKSEMVIPRDAHTAILLTDGIRVLIAGGLDGTGTTNTAEIYNTETGEFTKTKGDMLYARAFHTATLLSDGKVLLVGGYNGEYLNTTEIYNPLTDEFERSSDMSVARSNHAAALLSDGTVLVAGGRNSDTDVNEEGGLDTAEVYDPTAGGFFSETGNNMTSPRSFHTAINFKDDKDGINDRVIISGGFGPVGTEDEPELGALSTSDVYTPGTRMFSRSSSSLSRARQGHAAILLDEAAATGYLRFTSDMGLLASESYTVEKGGAPTSVGAINMAKYEGVQEVYSARFVVDADRTTLLNVINGNESPADITIELFDDNGVPITTLVDGNPIPVSITRHVAGNAQIKGALTDIFENYALAGKNGWIKVSSTQDQLVGTVTFKSATDKNKYLGSFVLSAVPSQAEPKYCYIFPLVSENGDFETELSFLNSGASSARLKLQLWDANSDPDNIQPGHMVAPEIEKNLGAGTVLGTPGTIFDIFGIRLDYGNVRVISDQPIHGTGVIRSKVDRFITPVPATMYKCP